MPDSLTGKELVAALAELPPVSSVLHRLLDVLDDPDSDLDDITRLIRAETALSAQVLRLESAQASARAYREALAQRNAAAATAENRLPVSMRPF